MAFSLPRLTGLSACVVLSLALGAAAARAGVNNVQNPGFEIVGGSGSSTSFTGIFYGGASAAASWSVYNNSSAATDTALISPSTDTVAPGGNSMLEVYTTGADNGVYQFFTPTAHYFSVDVLDQVGQVLLGAAEGGNDWVTGVVNPSLDWQHLTVYTPVEKNEIFIYAASASGAVFFVDNASASSAVPEPATWALLLLGSAGLALAGHRASRRGGSAARGIP